MEDRQRRFDQRDIPSFLPTWELLAMLAEECCELGQAALKVRRCLDDLNPTRMTFNEAISHLNEEWADVLLVIRQLNIIDQPMVYEIMKEKHDRWLKHLREHEKGEDVHGQQD